MQETTEWLHIALKRVRGWMNQKHVRKVAFVPVQVYWLDGSVGAVYCLVGMEIRTKRACSKMMPNDPSRCGKVIYSLRINGYPAVYPPDDDPPNQPVKRKDGFATLSPQVERTIIVRVEAWLGSRKIAFVPLQVRWFDGSLGTVCCFQGMESQTRRRCATIMPDDFSGCCKVISFFRRMGMASAYSHRDEASVAPAVAPQQV